MKHSSLPRRQFLQQSATALGAIGAVPAAADLPKPGGSDPAPAAAPAAPGKYNGSYLGPRLNRVAFPMGGIGAGMICLEGTGCLSHVSIRNQPSVFNEPCVFAALAIKGPHPIAKVLEGPVPGWKVFGGRDDANGAEGASYGLPRFAEARFQTRFPFGVVSLRDGEMPVTVELTGWSPFIPGDADNSSLPVAGLEYRFKNTSGAPVDAVFPSTPRTSSRSTARIAAG